MELRSETTFRSELVDLSMIASLVLDRGNIPNQHARGSDQLWIRCLTAKDEGLSGQTDGLFFVISVDQAPQCWLKWHSRVFPLNLRQDGYGWWVDRPLRLGPKPVDMAVGLWDAPFQGPVHPSSLPFPDRRSVLVSRYGWHEQNFYTGPLVHYCRQDAFGSYLPEGGRARLIIPLRESTEGRSLTDLAAALSDEGSRHRAVLVAAAGELFAPKRPGECLAIQLAALTLAEALALVAVRQAFFDDDIRVLTPQEQDVWHVSAWTRLMQNLGMTLGAEASEPESQHHPVSLSPLVRLIADQQAIPLAKAINQRSGVIPPALLR